MSRITSDILGMMGQRALADSRRAMNTAIERLATGKRINRASDDPAGLVAATNLSAQAKRAEREIHGLELSNRRLDATEGGLGVVSDLLVSLQSVVVEAANTGGRDKSEREALQIEAGSIIEALNHLSMSTSYNGEQILMGYHAGALGARTVVDSVTIDQTPKPDAPEDPFDPAYLEKLAEWAQHHGKTKVESHTIALADLAEGKALNLIDGDLKVAQEVVKAAVDQVSRSRAELGAKSNSNSSRIRALFAEFENTMAAKSAIEDTDFAREASELVRSQILGEASIRSILIGRQQAASVLRLL